MEWTALFEAAYSLRRVAFITDSYVQHGRGTFFAVGFYPVFSTMESLYRTTSYQLQPVAYSIFLVPLYHFRVYFHNIHNFHDFHNLDILIFIQCDQHQFRSPFVLGGGSNLIS